MSYKMSFQIRTIIEKQVAFKILQLKLVTFKNESMLKVKYQNIKWNVESIHFYMYS